MCRGTLSQRATVQMHNRNGHTADMAVETSGDVVRRIVSRTNLDQFAERVVDSFWERPEFQALHPPRHEVLAWVRWNLDLVIRWLIDARPPTEAELDVFRARARARAADGTPADLVPANFRRGARFAWGALLEAAGEEDRPALLGSADLLFEYVDQVSRIFSDVYQEAAASAATAEETAARALLARIGRDEAPLPEDHQFAQRIGFQLDRAARPFVISSPGREPVGVAGGTEYFGALAVQLRRRGALAASEGRRVVGLANHASAWREIRLDDRAIIAEGRSGIRGERGRALEELRMAAEVALIRGRAGVVAVGEYLPELLLRRSPRLAGQIRARVYGPLEEAHPELAHTLDLLVERSFERGTTAAALPVHRNTLRDRIKRISELTGVDLDRVEGRGLAWLAWLERHDSPSRPT